MKRPSRRSLFALGGAGLVSAFGTRLLVPHWLRARPLRARRDLSEEARGLIRAALEGVDESLLWDMHAHVVGLGSGGTGCFVGEGMRSHANPLQRLQYEIYLAASGVTDEADADRQFVERLFALQRDAFPGGTACLLAFDMQVGEDGVERPAASPFHTPNEYVLRLAAAHEGAVAVASVHPYRKDAVERLERCAEGGAVAVKWLPNAMGIDPASPRCDAFYAKLAEHGLPLLSHAGLEKAVHAEDAQELGNPLRLRRPLDAGCTVVVAHCASLGESLDLDQGAGKDAPRAQSFHLFLRLMGEERYRERLFGEISALPMINRSGEPLRTMLARGDLHARLVNGSDYPLPAIDPLFSTWLLARKGLLDPAERGPLEELFQANPLLFDFVLKRRLRLSEEGGVKRFSPVVFETGRLFA